MTQTSREHTVKSFSEELASLSAAVAHMGGLAEQQLAQAVQAISRRDSGLAEKTIADDTLIDELEVQIETDSVRVLALRQPMAQDLREVVSAVKISSDLERVGDLSKNIAKRTLLLNKEEPVRLTKGSTHMGRMVLTQLKDVLDAFSSRDAEKALAVWGRDEEIDELYNSLFRELLTYMMEDPRTIGSCAHLLFVAKNLERIGDHATNVAEIVYYLVVGKRLDDERPKGDMPPLTRADLESKDPA